MTRRSTESLALVVLALAAACTTDEQTGSLPPRVDAAALTIAEHAPVGTLVGTLTATVANGRKGTFSLADGNDDGVFAIDASGRLTVADARALDFEKTPSFTLKVEVTDDASATGSAEVAIAVTDVNEAPALADQTFHLSEEAEVGAVVGTLIVSDPDAGQSHTFAILGGNTGDTFAVDTTSGILTVASNALLNFDATPSFTLTVQATDSGDPALSVEATITIQLIDKNAPPLLSGGPFTVDEHMKEGSLIGTLTVVDEGDTHTFTLLGGNIGGAFVLDASTGTLVVADPQALDFETTPVFTLSVQATDAGGLTANATVIVSLSDVNEPPSLSGGPFSVTEHSVAGTVVGALTVADVDAGQTVALDLVGDNANATFALSGNAIVVANPLSLDFETTPTFTLTVRATDDGTPSASVETQVVISLADVNEAPALSGGPFTLEEHSPAGTEVGTLTVLDPDLGQTHTLTVSGDGADAFTFVGNRLVVAEGATLDFETTPSFTLTVRATDNGVPPAWVETQVVVTLTDVSEATSLAGGPFTLAENSPAGTEAGAVTVRFPVDGLTYTLSITGGNASNSFAFADDRLVVAQGATLDFETTPSFTLTVRATDDGTPPASVETQVVVTLTDVNEAPSLSGGPFTLAENSAAGTALGTLTVLDPDAGQAHTLSVSGDGSDAFDLVGNQLVVAQGATLDFETTQSFTLTVRATDDGSPPAWVETQIVVTLTDVNEAPAVSGGPFTLAENSPAGTELGPLTVLDADAGQTHTLTLSGNGSNAFTFVGHQLVVAEGATLDFESAASFTLTVRVTDNGTPSTWGETQIVVTLTDVNETPTVSGGPFTLAENSPAGTELGTLTVLDPDAGQAHTLTVSGNGSDAFAFVGNRLVVAQGATLDFETTPSFILTVRATDDGTPPSWGQAQIVVTLTDVNEAPSLSGGPFALAEKSPAGTEVGTLTVVDPDAGQTHTLTIVAGDAADAFTFAGKRLVVVSQAALDFESTPSFTLTVRATDDGTPSAWVETQVVVALTDVNEPPTLEHVALSVDENALPGHAVGTLTASDPDQGQTLLFAITGGNDGDTFALHPTSGSLTVLNSTLLDFEARKSFTLSVKVTDDGVPGLTATRDFTVSLLDANEAPVVDDAAFTLEENAAAGSLVGSLVASDPDAGDSVAFSMEPGHDGTFALSTDGRLTVANPAALDYETNPSFIFTVRATDADGLFTQATITVSLEDVNEAPTLSADKTSVSVPEDKPAGWQLAKLTTSDPDGGNTVTVEILSGNTGGAFALQGGWLVVDTPTAFDFEVNPAFTLTLRATDSGTPVLHTDLVITVQLVDVNEAPVVTAGQSFDVSSTAAIGQTVGYVAVTDPDAGQTLTYGFTGGQATQGYFGLEASTGRVYVATLTTAEGPLSGRIGLSYVLPVTVVDDGVPSLSGQGMLSVTVTAAGTPPASGALSFVTYTDRVYTMNLDEQASLGTPRAQVVSFGGGVFDTNTYPAGTEASLGGSGYLQVDADGKISISSYYSGTVTFTAQVENAEGTASLDVTIFVCVALEPGGAIHYYQWPEVCLKGDAEYVFVPTNLGSSDVVDVTATATNVVPVVGDPSPIVIPLAGALAPDELPKPDEAFEEALRRQEKEKLEPLMARARETRSGGPNQNIVPGVPTVGAFMTLNTASNGCDVPDNRTARVEAVSDHAVVMNEWKADKSGAVVPDGFSTSQFQQIAERFDTDIWPVITSTFGTPMDIDNNGRVVIFYTSAVNQLTPPGSSSYTGGFVHGRDIIPKAQCATSNEGEMFYMLSPDPSGSFGNVRTVDFVLDVTYGTLAHEFQHLINGSRRIYVNGATVWETVWLNEGLSHIAEELMFHHAAGTAPGQNLGKDDVYASLDAFLEWGLSNFGRLDSWLRAPHQDGPFADNDTLATRGAIWAFLRYAADRKGGDQTAFWSALVNSTTSGLDNLDAVLGTYTTWWVSDFAHAMYLDDSGLAVAPHREQPSWDFRSIFTILGEGIYPLAVRNAGSGTGITVPLAAGGGSAYVRMGVAAGEHGILKMQTNGEAPPATVELTLLRRK